MKVVEKIISDAQSAANKIIEEAKREVEKINKEAEESIKKIENEIENEANQLKEKEKSILIGKAKMEIRNDILQLKREILNDIFNEAINRLVNKGKDEYLSITKELIEKTGMKEGEIVISDKDNAIDNNFIEKINKEMGANFYLSKDKINILGGFILRSGKIEFDASFSSIINTKREEIELELIKLLF